MIGHVRREANFAAYSLSKAALMSITDVVWMEETLQFQCIFECVSVEQSL